nr:hypothetical protein C1892_21855 [Pseudomonas sp. MPBD7-1]
MGASLLAIAVYQSTSTQAEPPLSRASSLPQGGGAGLLCVFGAMAANLRQSAPCTNRRPLRT